MEKFEGYKFRKTGDIEYYRDYNTNKLKSKEQVIATKSYIEYLELCYIEKLEKEVSILKYRLNKEVQEFGECDKIDFQRYLGLLQEIYNRKEQIRLKSTSKKDVAKSGKFQPMKYHNIPQPYLPKPTK